MLKLPINTILGELRIIQTFQYFDIPRLFTCSNKSGFKYLVLSTYDDEEKYEWIYLPISNDRLSLILSNNMSLRNAFTNPEDNLIYKVTSDYEGNSNVINTLPNVLKDEDLPEQDIYLNIEEKVDVDLGVIDSRQAAISSQRETINIHLYPKDTNLPELAIRGFGAILTTFQDLMDALGQAIEGEPTLKGAIPSKILAQTQFKATQIFPGSFGIQLKSNNNCDLFTDSLASNTLQEFINLLKAGDNAELTSEKLHLFKGRVTSKYRLFLKELTNLDSPLKTDWGSPNVNKGDLLFIDKTTINMAYSVVSKIDIDMSESINFKAELLGIDSVKRSFRVRHLEDNEDYVGKIAEECSVEHSEINGIYKVNLKKVIETNSSSGSENIKWILFDLELD